MRALCWTVAACLCAAGQPAATPKPILPPPTAAAAKRYLDDLTDWIMTLDVGSQEVKHYNRTLNGLNQSIFINGNLARVLLGSYRLFGNASHLHEGLRWCDSLVQEQVTVNTSSGLTGGFWGAGYPTTVPLSQGRIYLGDTGTAVTTLAVCAGLTKDASQRARFMASLLRYQNFVLGGCDKPGCGALRRGSRPAPGFVNASAGGALGCGYYLGHLSTCPYVIATATTGAAFSAELLNLVGPAASPGRAATKLVQDAVEYMASLVAPGNGTIPYVIDCEVPDWTAWPLDTLSYVTEGVVSAFLHVPALRGELLTRFDASVEWLLRSQNSDGYWGSFRHAADLQRSPRVSTLLAWRAKAAPTGARPDPRLRAALVRYVDFLVAHGRDRYGVQEVLNTSGFVGLALLDMLAFGATFGAPRAESVFV